MSSGIVLDRQRQVDIDHIGKADQAGDRRAVADEIEIELGEQRRIGRVGRGGEEQRIAVRGGAQTAWVAMLVPAPGRLSTTNCWPSRSRQPLAEQARGQVGRSAGRIADNEVDRARRIGFGARHA